MIKNCNFKKVLMLITLIYASGSFAQSLNWNLATGGNPGRNGLSWALGPLVEVGGEPELYWEGGQSAQVASYPVIEGDNLIVTRRQSQEEAWIINYNVYTGEERWRTQLPIDTYHNYSKVSAVKDGLVFANRSGGATEPEFLYALDIETGEVIWKSEATYGEHATETVTFTENGDIIAADDERLLRINHIDGTTIWEMPRGGSSSDGNAVSAHNNKGYFWDQNSMGMFVSVCDLETGEFLYSSETLGSMGYQQGCLMVSPCGTIYAPIIRGNEDMDSLHALSDKGGYFEQMWSYPIFHATFGNHGVGPDGTVYTYSRDEGVVRLDPQTGEVLNTSIVVSGSNNFLSPTMAIGDDGMVYLSVEDWPYYKLYIFTQELELLWGEEIYGLRGVALGDSVMAINGKNSIIRAYKGRPNPTASITGLPKESDLIAVNPNPSTGIFSIYVKNDESNFAAKVDVINVSGQTVYSTNLSSGFEPFFIIDISGHKGGIYILRYFTGNKFHFQKIIKH